MLAEASTASTTRPSWRSVVTCRSTGSGEGEREDEHRQRAQQRRHPARGALMEAQFAPVEEEHQQRQERGHAQHRQHRPVAGEAEERFCFLLVHAREMRLLQPDLEE